jgi:transposase
MRYATKPHYEAGILSRNHLAPPLEPTMGNNPGRNAPLNQTDDKKTGRSMTLRFPKERQELLQAARVRQQTEEFKKIDHGRAGIEGTFSQTTRNPGPRRSRSSGLKKTPLQHILSAVATTILRFVRWRTGTPWAKTPTSRFAALAA